MLLSLDLLRRRGNRTCGGDENAVSQKRKAEADMMQASAFLCTKRFRKIHLRNSVFACCTGLVDCKKRRGFLKMRRKGTDYSGKITKT
jgi:hypothetical protein